MDKGARIKQLREAKGLSQVNLAKRIGVSKYLMNKYENNIVENIPSKNIERLAAALGTTPQHLMGWDIQDKE